MTRKIDYFFGLGSPWAYIGLDAFAALAQEFGLEVEPRVVPLIEENGGIYSRDRPEARRAYWLTDLRRWAALRGRALDLTDRARLSDPSPAGLLVTAAHLSGQDWLVLTRALQTAFWGRGEDIGAPEVRRRIVEAAGFDGAALEARAAEGDVRARQQADREAARAAGVFGLPTWRHDGALFWGQDSLAFLERQLRGETLIA